MSHKALNMTHGALTRKIHRWVCISTKKIQLSNSNVNDRLLPTVKQHSTCDVNTNVRNTYVQPTSNPKSIRHCRQVRGQLHKLQAPSHRCSWPTLQPTAQYRTLAVLTNKTEDELVSVLCGQPHNLIAYCDFSLSAQSPWPRKWWRSKLGDYV